MLRSTYKPNQSVLQPKPHYKHCIDTMYSQPSYIAIDTPHKTTSTASHTTVCHALSPKNRKDSKALPIHQSHQIHSHSSHDYFSLLFPTSPFPHLSPPSTPKPSPSSTLHTRSVPRPRTSASPARQTWPINPTPFVEKPCIDLRSTSELVGSTVFNQ